MGAERQTNIHTNIQTHTHTFRKTISGNQACTWFKKETTTKYIDTQIHTIEKDICSVSPFYKTGSHNIISNHHNAMCNTHNIAHNYTSVISYADIVGVSSCSNAKYRLKQANETSRNISILKH